MASLVSFTLLEAATVSLNGTSTLSFEMVGTLLGGLAFLPDSTHNDMFGLASASIGKPAIFDKVFSLEKVTKKTPSGIEENI